MSYIDSLAGQLEEIFGQAKDNQDLFQKVLSFVQNKAKESFRNGLESARNQRPKNKTRTY